MIRSRGTAGVRTGLLLLLAVVLFYWKITLTSQFSLLTGAEAVNQHYSWFQFWTHSIRHFSIPMWDPYVWGGRSFAGEMQTADFYPPHLLLAVIPQAHDAILSPHVYHFYFVFVHFLCAYFMFALVRGLGLGRMAAFVGGLCFSLGGFVVHMGWPHMLESSIWLPLIFLFFLRAIRAESVGRAMRSAACGGLMLGLSILAGGMHVVILQGIGLVSAGVYYGCVKKQAWPRVALAVAVICGIGLCAGAVQLVSSFEYSGQAIRFFGPIGGLAANQKIPYDYLNENLWPFGFVSMLIAQAFGGRIGNGEIINPYIGVFPLFLALVGIWRYWSNLWVRYLTGLALAAFLYAMGSMSPLHGLMYALVPKLWIAREAGRAVYLLDFAFAILAAFGVEFLFSAAWDAQVWAPVTRIFSWVALACGAGLLAPALYAKPEMSLWVAFSLVLILCSYGLYRMIVRGNRSGAMRVLMVALILFDLNAFDWLPRNRMEVERTDVNYLDRLMSLRKAAEFLKKQAGVFRTELAFDPTLNIGDMFEVQTVTGGGATLTIPFTKLSGKLDLLNVRYRIAPASDKQAGAVYQDAAWKIFEKPAAYPRAWVVHETAAETAGTVTDFRRTALVDSPVALDPLVAGDPEAVEFGEYSANRMDMRVHARSRGLLVLSEMFYPGWQASVNGSAARIYRADGGLRGVVVPGGDSVVAMRYRPWPVYFGGVLSIATFLGVGLVVVRRRAR